VNVLMIFVALASAEPTAAAPPPAAVASEAWELGRTEGLGALGGGIVLGATSMAAFAAGLEAERQLRAGEVRGQEEQSEALTQRAIAAWVAWPAAVLSVAGIVTGGWILTEDGAP
jgi:hypothetical protein